MKKAVYALAVSLLAAASAQAAPVSYRGTLVSGIYATGSAGGFGWFLDSGADVNFWSFSAKAGDTVTLEVDRLNANFDPGLSFYRGTTTADTSAFLSSGSWGGLTFIGSLDDEHPASLMPGPNGDPYGSFRISTAGLYTVAVGGSLSTDMGVYPYRIVMTDIAAAVPEPSTYALLGLGLAGVVVVVSARRRVNARG